MLYELLILLLMEAILFIVYLRLQTKHKNIHKIH